MARILNANRYYQRILGKSLFFNGTSDFATIPGLTLSTTGFSIAFWIKNLRYSNNARIIDWQDAAQTNGFVITQFISAGENYKVNPIIYNSTTAVANMAPNNLKTNFWYHIALTFRTNQATLYTNSVFTQQDTSCDMTGVSATMTLGRRASSGANFGSFFMSQLVYRNTDTPWTQSEVTDLYKYSRIPTGSSWWNFNDNTNDQSGNGFNITLNSGTSYSTEVPAAPRVRSSGRVIKSGRTTP